MRVTKSLSFAGVDFELVGNDADWYFNGIEQHVIQNDFIAPVLKHHVDSGGVILDIGANIGVTTALAHGLVPDATIISIEPSGAFEYLVETVQRNGMKRHQAIRCCIGDFDGEVSFVAPADNTSASHMIDKQHRQATDYKVPITTVDSLVAKLGIERLDFVKIDVEGHEMSVLDGMVNTNETYRPLVFMEFNSYALTALANISPRSVIERIYKEFGFFFIQDKGALKRVETESEAQAFLHTNMLHHQCVDDILFTRSAERAAALLV